MSLSLFLYMYTHTHTHTHTHITLQITPLIHHTPLINQSKVLRLKQIHRQVPASRIKSVKEALEFKWLLAYS